MSPRKSKVTPQAKQRLTLDQWQNALTGLGTATDKSQHNRYYATPQQSGVRLADQYRTNWLARRCVEAVPARALARGFSEETPMPEAFDDLNYAQWDEGALQRACYFGRLFGGAHLFIGYASGGADLEQPVTSKGNVAFLDVFTRHELQPARIGGKEARDENPASPTMGQVLIWEVTGDHPRAKMRYHSSRAIKFGGLSLPPAGLQTYTSASANSVQTKDRDWSDSVLTSVWDDLERYGVFWQSVSHLLQVASVGVLTIGGLIESLSQNNGEVMKARVDVFNQCLSLTRNILLDAERGENYKREAVSFADMPQLLDQLMIATAGAFDQPATELFGRAPQGMNATGEGDRLMWYSRVGEWRQRVLRPRVNALAEAISGQPTQIDYPEIHQPTDKELLELRNIRLTGNNLFWSQGVFSDQEIRSAEQKSELVEEFVKTPDVPEDPTRAVVQIKSETETNGAPPGPGPKPPAP
jgi:phage-related protein (TIGR01555 family)